MSNPQFVKKRISILQRRADHLKTRVEISNDTARSYNQAEMGALEWALDILKMLFRKELKEPK